jgi:PEGA domain-containing protein
MKTTKRAAMLGLTLAIPLTLALPAAAQRGGHSGGHSTSSTSPRSSSGSHTYSGGRAYSGPRSSYGGRTYGYRGGYRGGYYGGHAGGSYRWYPRLRNVYRDPFYWRWYWGGWFPYWTSVGWWWGWPYDYAYAPWGAYGGGYARHEVAAGRYARVKTDVNPDEAELFLNGKYIGTADDFDGYPDYLYLAPGKYHLEFKLAGHEGYAADLDVHRGETIKLDRKLKRLPGHGKLDSFDEPTHKGMPYGRVFGPDGNPPRERDWRDRERRRDAYARPDDREDDDFDVQEDRRDRDRDRDFDRDRDRDERPAMHGGLLRLRVTPADAAVYLDDQYVGVADEIAAKGGLAAAPGKHTVTVMRPGYKAQTVDVQAREGGPVDVVIDLQK